MKILSINIQNLASIEEAKIDLEEGPLANEPVFLICGDTGAGKSTILDAICLALYNNVPRLPSGNEKNGDIAIKDVRNMLRRGTGHGFAEVRFKALDNNIYTAKLTMRHAKDDPKLRIQDTIWTLTDSKGLVIDKKTEIESEMQRLIGLTFEQFKRTALLAQNQFAQFLVSTESQKAEILEMLTGTDIYTEISKAIFAKAKEVKEKHDTHSAMLRQINLLTEEEIAAINNTIAELEKQKRSLTDNNIAIEHKLAWIDRRDKIDEDIKSNTLALASAEAEQQSDALKQAAVTVEQFTHTEELRTTYLALLDSEQQLSSANQQLADSQTQLASLISTANSVATQASDSEALYNTKLAEQQAMQPNAKLYENGLYIADKLTEAASLQAEITKLKAQTDTLRSNEASQQATHNKLLAQRDATEAQLKQLTDELEKIKSANCHERLTQVTEQRARAEQLKGKCEQIKQNTDALLDKQVHINELKENITELKKTSDQLAAEHKALQTSLADAQLRVANAAQRLESDKLSADEFTQRLRRMLKPGAPCPVCGSTSHQTQPEEIFSKLLAESEAEKTAAEKAKADIDTLILGNAEKASKNAASIEGKTEQLKTAEADAAKLEQTTATLITEAGIGDNQSTAEAIAQHNAIIAACDAEIAELKKHIARIGKLTDATSEQNKKLRGTLADIEKSSKACAVAHADIENAVSSIAIREENAAKAISAANEHINIDNWEEHWRKDSNKFVTHLRTQSNTWRELCNQLPTIESQMKAAQQLHTQCAEQIAAIRATDTQLAGVQSSTNSTSIPADIVQQMVAFRTQVQQIIYNRDKASLRSANCRTELSNGIEAYNASHATAIKLTDVERLSAMRQTDIQKLLNAIDEAATKVVSARAALEQTQKQQCEHATHQHAPKADETKEQLVASQRALHKQTEATDTQLTQLKTQISTNEQQTLQHAKLQTQIKALTAELTKWITLNKLFGSGDGKAFSKIAQAYTLRFLLSKANYHLARINPRYTLECTDSGLSIIVCDNYMGGQRRSAVTLSGGESFLVSLALALGLSSLNEQRLRVETLFIDEGFGTLSSNCLETVTATLEQLRNQGCKVGIISHVAELKERIKAQIRVVRKNSSSSVVEIVN